MRRARSLFPLGALLLSGCLATVGPDYVAPELATPQVYSRLPELSAAATTETLWWRGYDDPQIESLVRLALARNLDIAAAEASVAEARALVGVAEALGGPTLDAGADASGQAVLAGQERGNGDGDLSGDADAGLLFSWTPDLFGGQRRRAEAAEAELRRRDLLRDDLRRTVAADTVRRYLEIRRDRARLELIESSLQIQRQTLELARQRFQAGLAAQLDVSRAQAQLAATQARRGPLRRDLANAEAALAVLTGQFPGQIQVPAPASLPGYAGGPALGLPNDLLRARPDVQAAEAVLARSVAEIGVETADLYPQLTLPGSLTAGATGFGTGSVVETLVAALSASLDVPLFDSGGRRAEVAAAEARAQEALLLYRRTLLDALAEAETALVGLAAAQERRNDLQAAVEASAEALEQARQLYTQGLVGFLDVLDAERTLLDNRQDLASAAADAALAVADLYSAVGAPAVPPGAEG